MAENYSKSKLKRKKSSVDELQPETSPRGPLQSSRAAAEPGRSAVPAAVWWNREQLPAVEALWASALTSALPHLENQHWDLVPDLPHPSTARPTAPQLDDRRRCDLSEEVAAFPEPCPPSQRTSSSPDLLRFSSSQRDLSVQTKPEPEPDPPDRQLSSHSRQSHDGGTTSLQALTKRPRLSLRSWEEAASSAGSSSVGGEEGRKGGEREEDTSSANTPLLTNQVRVSDSRVSLQEEEVVEDREQEEVQRSVRGDDGGGGGAGAGGGGGAAGGGGELQSCPLCLLVFPVGFTQMDCDGHLAQCLSEVNVDVTW